MNKRGKIAIIIFLALAFIVTATIMAKAIDPNASNSNIVPQKTGVDLSNLPKNPEDLKNQGEDYLTAEWKKFIEKSPFLGAIHQTLLKLSFIFQIFFAEPYTFFSWEFFMIIIIWIYFFFILNDIFKMLSMVKPGVASLLALIATILIAQAGFLKLIASSILKLTSGNYPLYINIAIIIGIIIVVVVLRMLTKIAKKYKMNAEKKKGEHEIEQTKKEVRGFFSGFRKGKG